MFNEEEFNEFYKQNEPLIYSVYKHYNTMFMNKEKEDIQQEMAFDFFKTYRDWIRLEKKYSFSTMFHLRVKHTLIKDIRNAKAKKREKIAADVSLNNIISNEYGNHIELGDFIEEIPYEDENDDMLFKRFLSLLDEENKQIVLLYYAGYTQSEIGSKIGLKQITVSRRLAKAKELYKSEIL